MCSINPSNNPELIQIRKCPISSFRVISLIDKFFLLGVVSGIVGACGMGTYLWLVFTGFINASYQINLIHKLHILLQINLFFGSFILGFCLHAAPKLIGSRTFANSLSIAFIPSLLIGFLLVAFWPQIIIGYILISLPFLLVAIFILRMSLGAAISTNLWLAYPLIYGLLVLAIAPFCNFSNPQKNLILFLLSIMQIVFATGQQFISGILSGRRLPQNLAIVALFLSIVVGVLFIVDSNPSTNLLLILCVGLQFIIYIWGTRSHLAFKNWRNSAFALSVASGNCWLLFSIVILVFELLPANYVLHTLSLGYALPITITTSCRIISALSGSLVLEDSSLKKLIAFWQVVPFFRILHYALPSVRAISIIFLLFVVSLLLNWSLRLINAIVVMNSRK